MKLLAFCLSICSASCAEVLTRLTNDGAFVTPSTTVTAQFFNRGNDIVHVVINGVDKGNLLPPYVTTYTSASVGGVNTFVVTTCDYMGRTATLNFSTTSQGRSFNKSPGR